MDIHNVDDLPFHQSAAPFNYPSTSDVHFNDGYYFGTYTDGLYVAWGMRLHPNMNVLDGWAGYAKDGRQTVARFTRALRPDYGPLRLGPLALDFVEPMKTVVARLEPSDAVPLSFDLTLTAQARPFLEAPHQHRKYGHLVNDLLRYSQHCHTTGRLTCEGSDITADGWLAVRDHSWGIRAAMGPRTSHGGVGATDEAPDRRRFRLWVHFEIGDRIGFFHTHEDERGETIDFEGILFDPDGSRTTLTGLRHQLEHFPGTKNLAGGTVALRDEHERWHELDLFPVGTPVDMHGFGYAGGWHDGGNAGVFRSAELLVERDSYPADPRLGRTGPPALDVARRMGPLEYPFGIRGSSGPAGRAHVEHHIMGRYEPYLGASLS